MALITPPTTPDPTAKDLDIVIAHFNEDLSWLSDSSKSAIIYSKGSSPPLSQAPLLKNTINLPNIARESHTYLTHIVRNYDSLPPLTLFLQGNIHDMNNGTPEHTDMTLDEITECTSKYADGRTMPIGRVHTFSDWDGIKYLPGWIERRGKTLKRTKLTPGQFWEVIFDEPHPENVRYVQGALFAATSGAIRRRPKSFYEDLLRYFEDLNEVNPEEGHYMERFWFAILSDEAFEVEEEVQADGVEKGDIR